jgi:ubiquinone/menaquinone biosynthesis C-methylase UbiE
VRALQDRTLATCASFLLPYLRPGMTVLDCGCGPGVMTIEIAERVAPGQVVGIDIDPGQCARAQALAADRGVTNVRFEPADVYALPYPDASFDVMFSHALVTHLSEPIRALVESRRVLKPDGVLAPSGNEFDAVALSPDDSPMKRLMALYARLLTHNGGSRVCVRHLRGALLEAGFARVEGHADHSEYGAPEQLRSIAAAYAAIARGSSFVETVVGQGWADQAEMAALPDEVLRWGEHPDAFMAVMKCGALGWVNRR